MNIVILLSEYVLEDSWRLLLQILSHWVWIPPFCGNFLMADTETHQQELDLCIFKVVQNSVIQQLPEWLVEKLMSVKQDWLWKSWMFIADF